mgnify:CR=1 FL=1
MLIQIPRYEIKKYFPKKTIENPNFSEILTNYIQDNYFNGADNAVIYIGYNPEETVFDSGYYELEIIQG